MITVVTGMTGINFQLQGVIMQTVQAIDSLGPLPAHQTLLDSRGRRQDCPMSDLISNTVFSFDSAPLSSSLVTPCSLTAVILPALLCSRVMITIPFLALNLLAVP